MGLICALMIVIGVIMLLNGFLMEPESAMQQTVQYLSYIGGIICLCDGFIVTALMLLKDELVKKQDTVPNNTDSSQGKKTSKTKEPLSIPEYNETVFGNKEEWISKRIMNLVNTTYSESDAKVRAETEYTLSKIEYEKKKKVSENLDKQKATFKDNNSFSYSEHEQVLSSFSNAKEILQYLESLNIQNDYFKDTILNSIKDIVEIERLYGNQKEDVLKKLKEL